jgi:general L-amino acid transport system substrate-binding protein
MTFITRAISSLGLLCVLAAGCGSAGDPAVSAQARDRGAAATPTLDAIRRRGFVQCGVSTGIAGFSAPDAQGEWRGLDVDICRATAAAVLGDAMKVRFTPLSAAQRFAALQAGEIDLLSRVTTITFQRDVQLGIEFPVIDWYDGTGFIVPDPRNGARVKTAKDLNRATICLQPGTTNELDVADFFRRNSLTFKPVVIERLEEVTNAYFAGRCDAFSQDQSTLAAVRRRAPDPAGHVVLPEVISKAPYGPGVMPNDLRWMEIVRWSVYAMIDAEELGLGTKTIDRARVSDDPAIQRFVGTSGGFGAMLGLDPDWAFQIVKQVGSYEESFERNLAPLGIERGLNRLWKHGGILYAPDLR